MSLVETLLTLAFVCVMGMVIFPFFSNLSKFSRGSGFKETCQRLVNAKIGEYQAMSRDSLRVRYKSYRLGGTRTSHMLCGSASNGNPAPTPVASEYRAKLSTFESGQYGLAPELGIRECVQLTQDNPDYDRRVNDWVGAPYSNGFCAVDPGHPGVLRKHDQEALASIPGLKTYVRMRLTGSWNETDAWFCPQTVELDPTVLNQALEIQVTAVADYASIGLRDLGGITDPNRLMCSAKTSVLMSKETGAFSFRYFAFQNSYNQWEIRKVSNGWKTNSEAVYAPLAMGMNTTTLPGVPMPPSAIVTQFGISPNGTRGFFVRANENETDTNSDPSLRVPLTSFFCAMEGLKEGDSGGYTVQPQCRVLPRFPGNQIESVMIDWKKGKMWGVASRHAFPDRLAAPPENQNIDGVYLLADCSHTLASDREHALLFGGSMCMGSGNRPMPSPVPLSNGDTTVTDMSFSNARKLDQTFLALKVEDAYSPGAPTLPGETTRDDHLDARSLRYLPDLFSNGGGGALFGIQSTPPRNCGPANRCLTKARARLFYSPDALSAYAVLRYPGNSSESGCSVSMSDSYAQVYRLEIPNAAGAESTSTICPEEILGLTKEINGVQVLPELMSF